MTGARILLLLGALLLLATAAFHASGGAMVAGWLDGERGQILRLLWFVPPIDWVVVALIWAFAAWRPSRVLAAIVWLSALIPLAVAGMLLVTIGPGFPGGWMLLGATILAGFGAARLRVV